MASQSSGILFVFLLLSGIAGVPLEQSAFAQKNDSNVVFSAKGVIAPNSHFSGIVMWTIIHDSKGIVILQGPEGRGVAHFSVSSSDACVSNITVCLFTNVTDTKNIEAFKVNDTARWAIDPSNKQETITMLTGFLAGVEVTVNLYKTGQPAHTSNNTNSTSG